MLLLVPDGDAEGPRQAPWPSLQDACLVTSYRDRRGWEDRGSRGWRAATRDPVYHEAIYVIQDNLSSHTSGPIQAWLDTPHQPPGTTLLTPTTAAVMVNRDAVSDAQAGEPSPRVDDSTWLVPWNDATLPIRRARFARGSMTVQVAATDRRGTHRNHHLARSRHWIGKGSDRDDATARPSNRS
jgi:hypothetical protein